VEQLAHKQNLKSVAVYSIVLSFRSTHGGPDWTCVIVGFSSGYVRMYTQVFVLFVLDSYASASVLQLEALCFLAIRASACLCFLNDILNTVS